MAKPAVQITVRMPSDEEIKAAFQRYTDGVGRVVHSWNFLHEKLGQLFLAVFDAEKSVVMSVWYAIDSDRSQRKMLEAATKAKPKVGWPQKDSGEPIYDYVSEILWLLKETDVLANQRNNAIHAPASLYIGDAGENPADMGAWFLYGHPRAKNLMGKKLLDEFLLYEQKAEILAQHCLAINTALSFPKTHGIPHRPLLPTRGQKSTHRDPRPRQERTKQPPPPP
jgi:hypothetical protein